MHPRRDRHAGPDARDLGLSPTSDRPVPDAALTPQPVPIPVVYEDEILLVVDKPAGLATMPRGRYVARSVVAQLRWARADDRIIAAHRLDRLTSGVLVLVKDPAWRGRVQTLFERRSPGLTKTYLARTSARPAASAYTRAAAPHLDGLEPLIAAVPYDVTLPLLKAPGVWQCRIDPDGRLSRTRILTREEHGALTTWTLSPLTGYTHQLRVTLAALGHPVHGDPLYPEVSPLYTSDAGDAVRMDLHAASLTLPRPPGAPHWPEVLTAPPPWTETADPQQRQGSDTHTIVD